MCQHSPHVSAVCSCHASTFKEDRARAYPRTLTDLYWQQARALRATVDITRQKWPGHISRPRDEPWAQSDDAHFPGRLIMHPGYTGGMNHQLHICINHQMLYWLYPKFFFQKVVQAEIAFSGHLRSYGNVVLPVFRFRTKKSIHFWLKRRFTGQFDASSS